MNTLHQVLLARNVADPNLELPVPVPLVISWRTSPAPVDGGPAPAVAAVLAEALCRVATVSFLSYDAGRERKLASAFNRFLIPDVFTPIVSRDDPKKAPLVSTSDPAVAVQLFDTGYFDWNQRGQVVLLSQPGEPVPAAPPDPFKIHEKLVPVAASAGFSGLLLPGVDGDLAGLWPFALDFEKNFLDALAKSCRNASIPLGTLTMDELRDRLADPKHQTPHGA